LTQIRIKMDINDKTSYKALKEYIKENGFQKIYLEEKGKPYTKSTKDELKSFIKEKQNEKDVVDHLDTIIGNTIQPDSEIDNNKSENEINIETLLNPNSENVDTKNEDQDPEIEEIPVFKNHSHQTKLPDSGESSQKDKLDLNRNQRKVLKYITRFPEKLKVITSRPTFKQEFATLRDYNPDQNDEENIANEKLRHEIEQTLNGANVGALVLDKIFITVDAIETIIVAIRENKNGKIPQYIVDTVGQIRIEGLAKVLQDNPNFHDCIDELLIKYDSYEGLLKYLNVETRLMLIILGSAYLVHKGNVKKDQLIKESQTAQGNAKMQGVQSRYAGL